MRQRIQVKCEVTATKYFERICGSDGNVAGVALAFDLSAEGLAKVEGLAK